MNAHKDFTVKTQIYPSKDKRDEFKKAGKPGEAPNYVGSEDGEIWFTFPPTADFPVYGGELKLTVPNWYLSSKGDISMADKSVFGGGI